MATCNQCGNKLKPGEFLTCAECLDVLRIIKQRIANAVKQAESRDNKRGR
jgi:hypothetical protein